MKYLMLGAALLAVLCAPPFRAARAASPGGPEVHEVRMTAKKYTFTPDTITVRQGERVRLVITAIDREHGFELAGYHIDQKLPKGVPTTVEFTADKAGTFNFKCSVFCGLGHRHMRGKLVVESR